MVKKLKLPPLNDKTKILSFDLETNGLHGKVFAIGAVVVDASDHIVDQFAGRCEINDPIDPWVEQNVLPVIGDMPVKYHSYTQLREAFWEWYLKAEPKSDYVLVSNGYPVEYRFLIECQEADLEERYWQHPFPILDLTSLLLQVGEADMANKGEFMREIIAKVPGKPHHPVFDATTTALAAFKAFRTSNQLS